jgi:Cu/Ag efflux pump CusA
MIYVVFGDKVDLHFARARVLTRMSLVTDCAGDRVDSVRR